MGRPWYAAHAGGPTGFPVRTGSLGSSAPGGRLGIVVDPHSVPESRLVLGLMSGMSMDGLDVALVRLEGLGERPAVTLQAATTLPYEDALRERLQAARGATGAESGALHTELADAWGSSVRGWLDEQSIAPGGVTCLGSHGQTLWHRPRSMGRAAATLQVGDGARLAQAVGVPVVSDFRTADIEAGGEGAPLVPMADWILHGDDQRTIACNNLGSISNVTVLPPAREAILAFDTGPANMLIDAFARRATGDIDRDGAVSAPARIDADVLHTLTMRRAAWLTQEPPKSAGYGTFGPELIDDIVASHPGADPRDLVRTAVEFSATTLADAYERFVVPRHGDLRRVLFSGGGTHNPTLMASIRAHLEPLGLQAEIVSGAMNDAKEAVAFALLADRTWRGLPGNVPSATGAGASVVLGAVALP